MAAPSKRKSFRDRIGLSILSIISSPETETTRPKIDTARW